MFARICILFSLLFLTAVCACSQQSPAEMEAISRRRIDSFSRLLQLQHTDTGKTKILLFLGGNYFLISRDSALLCYQQALTLAQRTNYDFGQTQSLRALVDLYAQLGDYPKALELALYNLQLAKKGTDTMNLFWATRSIWRSYEAMLNYPMVLDYAQRVKAIVHSGYFKNASNVQYYSLVGYVNAMATAYKGLNQLDSAFYFGMLSYQTARSLNDSGMQALATIYLGDFYQEKWQYDSAYAFYRMTMQYAVSVRRQDLVADAYLGIAKLFEGRKVFDSALSYGRRALNIFKHIKYPVHELKAITFLGALFAAQNQWDSAYRYQAVMLALKDSLFNDEKIRQVQTIGFTEMLHQQRVELAKSEAQKRYDVRMKACFVVGLLFLLMVVVVFLYRLRQVRQENQLTTIFTKKIHQIEMRALRAQMNPHFIFNCLNSINRYIVKSDHKTASNYLTKFARLIRLILDNSANESIALDKEIQTLQLYVDMEKLRFDNVFDYFIEVDKDILPDTISIPSMLLQPYVENAIWHGLLHKENRDGKLWVRFYQSTENVLIAEVEDNGVGRQMAKKMRSKDVIRKKSYGMQISKDRIFLINELYDTNASVRIDDLKDERGAACGTKVTVEIPAKPY